jgi:hypothetical protein
LKEKQRVEIGRKKIDFSIYVNFFFTEGLPARDGFSGLENLCYLAETNGVKRNMAGK